MPPNTPSQVFLGDTRGASGTRPNHRPAKNAPVSAAHTSASVNSTQWVLLRGERDVNQRQPARHQCQQSGERRGDRMSRASVRGRSTGTRRSTTAIATVIDDAHEAGDGAVEIEAGDQRDATTSA